MHHVSVYKVFRTDEGFRGVWWDTRPADSLDEAQVIQESFVEQYVPEDQVDQPSIGGCVYHVLIEDKQPAHWRAAELHYVNVYNVTRAYGGPEEGGWWYDVGDSEESYRAATLAEAQELRDKLEAEHGRSGLSSVRVYIEDKPATDFPYERPYYC